MVTRREEEEEEEESRMQVRPEKEEQGSGAVKSHVEKKGLCLVVYTSVRLFLMVKRAFRSEG